MHIFKAGTTCQIGGRSRLELIESYGVDSPDIRCDMSVSIENRLLGWLNRCHDSVTTVLSSLCASMLMVFKT